ncbi:hypothetical protein [Rhizobium sp. AN83]|uniref:hypothetical protein n=1 Tax=Rhizobium sp. AN83 TaxID=3035217 RepID=UPI002B25EAA6|nr:hypothetical protein [Rhizobium sp. AN83]
MSKVESAPLPPLPGTTVLSLTEKDRSNVNRWIDSRVRNLLMGDGSYRPDGPKLPVSDIYDNVKLFLDRLGNMAYEIDDPLNIVRDKISSYNDDMTALLELKTKFEINAKSPPDRIDVFPPKNSDTKTPVFDPRGPGFPASYTGQYEINALKSFLNNSYGVAESGLQPREQRNLFETMAMNEIARQSILTKDAWRDYEKQVSDFSKTWTPINRPSDYWQKHRSMVDLARNAQQVWSDVMDFGAKILGVDLDDLFTPLNEVTKAIRKQQELNKAEWQTTAKAEAERQAAAKADALRQAAAKAEAQRQAAAKAEAERQAAAKAEAERQAAATAEAERQAAAKAEAERQAAAKAEAERQAAAKAEAERQAAAKAEAERQAAAKAEAERQAAAKAEAKRQAAAKAEAERQAAAKAEAERQAAAKAEAERQAAAKAEAERQAAAKAEAERQAAAKAEAERQAAAKAEAERQAAAKAEAERQARIKAEVDRQAAARLEADRLAAQKAEAERRETILRESAERQRQWNLRQQREAEERRQQAAADQARRDAEQDRMRRQMDSVRIPGTGNGKRPAPGTPVPSPRPNPPSQWRPGYRGFPVIMDVNGDGQLDLRTLSAVEAADGSQPAFDWNGDGKRDATAWVGPSDGLLIIDLDIDTGGPDLTVKSIGRKKSLSHSGSRRRSEWPNSKRKALTTPVVRSPILKGCVSRSIQIRTIFSTIVMRDGANSVSGRISTKTA